MFVIISNQMVVMFILILIGYLIRKISLVDNRGEKTLSGVLLMLVNPLLILNSFLTVEFDPARVRGFLWTILFAVIAHVVGILTAHFLVRGKDPDAMIERFSAVYSNCGFMGIPLIQSILGAEGVFYITAYIVVFNILAWTHGLITITGDTSVKQLARGLRSPVVISILIGLICYFFRISFPVPVEKAVTYVADMNTPLGMIIAGAALAESHPLLVLKHRRVYLVSAVKLLIMPLLTILIALPFHPDAAVFYSVVVAAASPAATTGTMMAMRYDRNYHYASELFVLTTLLSLLSIPAVVAFAELLF